MIPSSQEEANEPAKRPRPLKRGTDLVLKGLCGRDPAAELGRKTGLSPTIYSRRRTQLMNAARTGPARPEAKYHALEERLKQLEEENARLRMDARIFRDLCAID